MRWRRRLGGPELKALIWFPRFVFGGRYGGNHFRLRSEFDFSPVGPRVPGLTSGFSLPPGDRLEADLFTGYLRDADLRKFRVGSKFIVLSIGLSKQPLV